MSILPWNAQAAKDNGGRWVNPDYDSTTSTFGKVNANILAGLDSGSGIVGAINGAADMISTLKDNAAYNNAWSADQARIQREWQEVQNAKAMEFNANQAAINRNWQAMMSNTAHQREIADLKAAGLNPVLSAMNGNGAAVTSGATASGVTSAGAKGETDTSLNSSLVNLLGAIYNRTTAIEAANINARTQEAVADKYNATSEIVAQLGLLASKYSADSAYASSKYHSDMTKWLQENYPSNAFQALAGLIGSFFSSDPKDSVNTILGVGGQTGEALAEMVELFDGYNPKGYMGNLLKAIASIYRVRSK